MDGIDLYKITIQPNPFDRTIRNIVEIEEKMTYREIYESISPSYPIDYAVIFDFDTKVEEEDLDKYPVHETIYIKVMPSGSNKKTGVGMKIGGALLTAVGIALIIASWGTLSPMGVLLVGSGISMMLGGTVLYNLELPSAVLPTAGGDVVAPSLRGGKNSARFGARVPILLGKHLMVPDYCALPYVDIEGNDQYLYQYFCLGYKDIVIDESSYKIGDTPLTSEYFDAVINKTVTGSPNSFFPNRKVQTGIGRELLASGTSTTTRVEVPPAEPVVQYSNGGQPYAPPTYPTYYNVTTYTTDTGNEILLSTPTNVRSIDLFLTFPSGLVYRDSEGKKSNLTAKIKYKIRQNYGNGTFGAWGTEVETVFTDKIDKTKRVKIPITLSNDAPGDPDYHVRRQYDVQVFKVYEGGEESYNYAKKVVWDCMSCQTATFDTTTHLLVNDEPINTTVRDNLSLMSIKIKATDTANNIISQFNLVGQLSAPIYSGFGSGAGSWAVSAPTSNPASCMLYILRNGLAQKRPVTDDQIDWVSFENWYDYCFNAGLECNAVISGEVTTEDICNSIISTGRASWAIVDGKYSINVDEIQPNIIQYFTPRNSWNFNASKIFTKSPTALNMSFVDKAIGYSAAQRKVYVNDLVEDDTAVQEVKLFGVTSADEAYKHGKYMLACTLLRPEVFTFDADFESVVCTRSDRIALNHDVIFAGLNTGRITDLHGTTDITGIVLDERVVFEAGKSYGVTIRKNDGTSITKAILNPAVTNNIETTSLYFAVHEALGALQNDELCMFGISGAETEDFLIISIEPKDDLSVTITCVNYSPDIFDADTGTIPDYNPGISLPGSYESAVVMGISLDPQVESVNNAKQIAQTDNIQTALTTLNLINNDITPGVGDATSVSLYDTANYANLGVSFPEKWEFYGSVSPDSAMIGKNLYYIAWKGDSYANGVWLYRVDTSSQLVYSVMELPAGSVYISTDGTDLYITTSTATPTIYKYTLKYGTLETVYTSTEAMYSVRYYKDHLFAYFATSKLIKKLALKTNTWSTLYNASASPHIPSLCPAGNYLYFKLQYAISKIDLNTNITTAVATAPGTIYTMVSDEVTVYMVIATAQWNVYGYTIATDVLATTNVLTENINRLSWSTIDSKFYGTSQTAIINYVPSTNVVTRMIGEYPFTTITDKGTVGGDYYNSTFLTTTDSTELPVPIATSNDGVVTVLTERMSHYTMSVSNTTPVACYNYLKDTTGLYFGINCYPVVKEYEDGFIICQDTDITINSKTMTAGKLYVIPKTGLFNDTYTDIYFTEVPIDYTTYKLMTTIYDFIDNDTIAIVRNDGGTHTIATFTLSTGAYISNLCIPLNNQWFFNISQMSYIGFDTLLFSDADMNIYVIPTTSTTTGLMTPYIWDSNIRYFCATKDQAIFIDCTGKVFYQARSRATQVIQNQPILKSTTSTIEIVGTLTTGSNIVTDISVAHYNRIETGNNVVGIGIAYGTTILNKRDGVIYLSNVSTVSQVADLICNSNKQVFNVTDILTATTAYGIDNYDGVSNMITLKLPRGLLMVSGRSYASPTGTVKDSTKSGVYNVNYIDSVNYTTSVVGTDTMGLTFQIINGDLYVVTPTVAGSDPQLSYIILQGV